MRGKGEMKNSREKRRRKRETKKKRGVKKKLKKRGKEKLKKRGGIYKIGGEKTDNEGAMRNGKIPGK